MSDPVTYTFHGTTIPVLRNQTQTAINTLRAAKDEQSKDSNLPSDAEILDSKLNADMLPFRMQPILLLKFPLSGISYLELSKVEVPQLRPDFQTLDDVIALLESVVKVYDSIDPEAYNAAAEKSVDVPMENRGITLHMTGFADYYHGFVIPNSWFHLSAMYMLLRSKGFKLGKGHWVGSFMSETQQKDWAPIRG